MNKFGVTMIILVLLTPVNTFALTSEEHLDTPLGTQYVILTEADSKNTYKADILSLTMSISPDSFGSDVSDIHDITYFVKIEESGSYVNNQQKSITTVIDQTGESVVEQFGFQVDDDIPQYPHVFVRVTFKEGVADSTDTEIDSGWIFAFTLVVYPSFRNAFIGVLIAFVTILALSIIIRSIRKSKSETSVTKTKTDTQEVISETVIMDPQPDEAKTEETPNADPEQKVGATTIFCTNCGSDLPGDDGFCVTCGTKLST